MSVLLQPSCFLAEWYWPELTSRTIEDINDKLNTSAATMRAEGIQVQLIITLAVPKDEVLYGMFSANSADTVVLACERAGIPLERLSSDVLLGSAWQPRGSPDPDANHTNE